jgi:hypothetical protein
MGHDPTTAPTRGNGLTRRTFLSAGGALLGSALVLGPNAGSQGTRHSALAQLAAKDGPRLPLTYLPSSDGATIDEVRALLKAGGAQAVPAVGLRTGGAPITGGAARVQVAGNALGLPGSGAITGAQLDALMQPINAGADAPLLPFYAWTYQSGSSGQPGQGLGFVVPFEREPTLGFALRSRTDAGASTPSSWSESSAVLTGGSERGMAKLRQGAYVAGLAPGAPLVTGSLPAADDPVWASRPSLIFIVHAL